MEPRTRHGVTYDHCPGCGGVWLDRGEIDHLIEAVRPAVALPDPTPPSPPEPAPKPVPPRPEPAPGTRAAPRSERGRDRDDDDDDDRNRPHKHATRFGGRYSAQTRLRDLIEEIFDFD